MISIVALALAVCSSSPARADSCTTTCLSYSSPGVCNIYDTTCSDGSTTLGTCTYGDYSGNCTGISNGNQNCSLSCSNYDANGTCTSYSSYCN